MKKFLLFFVALFMAAGVMKAQDAPLYSATAKICIDEDWAPNYDGNFPSTSGIKVDVYEGYAVVHGIAGVEGYDMIVEFDGEDNVLSVTPVVNGVEGDPVSKGYCTLYTGLEGEYSYIMAYISSGFCYAGVEEDKSGYVFLSAYNSLGNYIYYNLEWEGLPEGCLYIESGEAKETEGWGATEFPYIRDIKVEVYEGYCIVRSWAGVEGYDMMVEVGENDAILSVTPIINGEEGDPVSSGFLNLQTGREDFTSIQLYLAEGYCYGGFDSSNNSGYLLLGCYIGEAWTYYYLEWPQGEEGGNTEWVNPFEGEATYLYSAIAKTCDVVDAEDTPDDEKWGESFFPVVENIKVDVYDKYIYIHALGGVEGYDAKVAYNDSESVLSIIAVVKGEESEPCRNYIYLSTGREDYVTIQTFPGYSYAGTNENNSGYVTLAAYLYDANGESSWNYYNLSWENGQINDGISTVKADANSAAYNLAGQRVNATYKGIVLRDGKKTLQK